MLLLLVRVDLGAMATKKYSAFSNAPALLEATIEYPGYLSGESYLSAKIQLVFYTPNQVDGGLYRLYAVK